MLSIRRIFPPLVVLVDLSACGRAPSPPTADVRPTDAFEIATAPLTLPGVGFVCYDFRVANGQGQTVVERGVPGLPFHAPFAALTDVGAVCSGQFGNGTGGDISYVAPCDAQPLPAGNEINRVTLWVDGLYTGTQAAPTGTLEYLDPCPGGCTVAGLCQENADTPITFNLTIMRPANQGFFDVAVNFEDIFCSAKLDCTYEGETEPITLLHNPNKPGAPRDTTFVVGLACTGGSGSDTHLYMNPGELICYSDSVNKGVRVNFSSTGLEEGNMKQIAGSFTTTVHDLVTTAAGTAWGPSTGFFPDPQFLFQHAYYRGVESLGDYNKVYSNAAYGVDYAVLETWLATQGTYTNDVRCVYSNHATASDGPMATDTNMFYPQVQFCAEVFAVDSVCGQNPLNDPDAAPIADFNDLDGTMQGGVFTTYSTPSGPDNLETCAPDTDPPYELCIHPVSGELVACDPLEGGPIFTLIEEPRPDVAHGATNCDSTPLSVTFSLTEGWAYCRVAHADNVATADWTLCGYPDIGPNTWDFWTASGPTPGTYGTQNLEIMVTDGITQTLVHTNSWYVHESLEDCCYCDEDPLVAWPSDSAFFAAALEPMPLERYNTYVAERGDNTNRLWELPAGGVLDTSVRFDAGDILLPPIQSLTFTDVSIVGMPMEYAEVRAVTETNLTRLSGTPAYTDSYTYGRCSNNIFTRCMTDFRCELISAGGVCQNQNGIPLFRKMRIDDNRVFSLFDSAVTTATYSSTYLNGNIVETAFAGTPRTRVWNGVTSPVPTVSFAHEFMSLRKRIVFNDDRTLVLIHRAVESRLDRWNAGVSNCRLSLTFGFYKDKRDEFNAVTERMRSVVEFDAIVMNARGQGYGLRLNPLSGLPEAVIYSDRMVAKIFNDAVAGRPNARDDNLSILSPKVYDPNRVFGAVWQAWWTGTDLRDEGAGNGDSTYAMPPLIVWD